MIIKLIQILIERCRNCECQNISNEKILIIREGFKNKDLIEITLDRSSPKIKILSHSQSPNLNLKRSWFRNKL